MPAMPPNARTPRPVLGLAACAGVALLGATATAQPGDSPTTGPTGRGDAGGPASPAPAVSPAQPRIIVVPAQPPTLQPVRPNVPPTPFTDLDLTSSPPLMREGAFVSTARAQVVKGKSGRWYAIFDPDAAGRLIPPMILSESPHLGAIERAAEHGTPGMRLRLTGRVSVYRDRNFLLPTAPPIIERGEAPAPATSPTPTTPAGGPTEGQGQAAEPKSVAGAAPTDKPAPTDSAADPSIERIIADLDKAAGPRRPSVTAAPPPPPVAEGAPSATGAAPAAGYEKSGFLAARRARVVRGADGVPMAVVDSGPAGKPEGPFMLLPCQNLTAIESYVDTLGDTASFTLTGEVHGYQGRRYLLPTMFVVNRAQALVSPTQ